jgi:threonine dehydrogenase-like Zn-dependent dehydrogenase
LAAVLDYVRNGGRVTFVGISIGRKVPVELGKIQSKSLTIKGTIGSPGVWLAALRASGADEARPVADPDPLFDLTDGSRP